MRLAVVDVGNTSTAVGLWVDGRVTNIAHIDGSIDEAFLDITDCRFKDGLEAAFYIKDRVKKEVRKGQRELEHVINSTSRHSDGSLRYTSGVSDKESRSTKFVDLAI